MPTSSPIHLRRCTPTDWPTIQTLGRQIFSDTFAVHNTPENLQTYLDTAFSTEQIQAQLANPDSQFWLAIQEENQAVGYLKINFAGAQTEAQPEPSLEIERIYVLQSLQSAGVGQMLFEKSLEIARAAGVKYIWLGVWEHNPKAIRFYEKNGMHIFDQHTFHLGDEAQTDMMMKLDL